MSGLEHDAAAPRLAADAAPLLGIDGLEVELGGRAIVDGASLEVAPGEIVGLMGPNGCGKSTILRAVYRALQPAGGAILIDGEPLASLSFGRSAQLIGALAQQSASDFDFTVEETVAMGRLPHRPGSRLSPREQELCEEALERMGIGHLRGRGMLDLSGGERQRVLIARALVQEPRLLVLDEPTNHLDLAHQAQLAQLLPQLGCGVLVVLHDLNLAAAVCDRLHFMRDGRIVASGTPEELITRPLVREVFDLDVEIVRHPRTGAPQILFRGLEPRHAPTPEPR